MSAVLKLVNLYSGYPDTFEISDEEIDSIQRVREHTVVLHGGYSHFWYTGIEFIDGLQIRVNDTLQDLYEKFGWEYKPIYSVTYQDVENIAPDSVIARHQDERIKRELHAANYVL